MKITESYIRAKNDNMEDCEDGIFIGEHVIAVIDGCTSKSDHVWNGKKGGLFAKDLICEALRGQVPTDDPEIFFETLNNTIKNAVRDESGLKKEDLPRASVIAFIPAQNEIWAYGDCRCIVNKEVFLHEKEIDVELSDKRARVIEEGLSNGRSIAELAEKDFGREAILPDLLKQFEYENVHCVVNDTDLGYPVLNGEPLCKDMIVVHPVAPGEEVVLASDGYPVLKNSLEESETELARLLTEDPFCYKTYKSTKGLKKGNISFDDRSYIRFSTFDGS